MNSQQPFSSFLYPAPLWTVITIQSISCKWPSVFLLDESIRRTVLWPTFVVFISFCLCESEERRSLVEHHQNMQHELKIPQNTLVTKILLFSHFGREKGNQKRIHSIAYMLICNSYFLSHIILGRKSITFGLRVIMGLKSCPVMQI